MRTKKEINEDLWALNEMKSPFVKDFVDSVTNIVWKGHKLVRLLKSQNRKLKEENKSLTMNLNEASKELASYL